jgi:uncharacterized protein with gpF-like domain
MPRVKPPPRLSRKKAQWAGQFKPALLRGTTLQPSARTQQWFMDELSGLAERMARDVSRSFLALLKSPAGAAVMDEGTGGKPKKPPGRTTGSLASQSRILGNRLSEKWASLFDKKAAALAEKMVRGMARSSTQALKGSIKKATGAAIRTDALERGGTLAEVFKASVTEAATLIKRIPQTFMTKTIEALSRSIATHAGTASLYGYFEEQAAKNNVQIKNWAYNTARDQTNKVFSNMTRERMKNAGLTKFEWVHSGGGSQPRELHITPFEQGGLNGGIFDLSDPPVADARTGERALPGQLVNCRCKYRIILELGPSGG